MKAKAPGKVILLGEHSVVYGYQALAAAIELGMQATVEATTGPVSLHIPAWQVVIRLGEHQPDCQALEQMLEVILANLPVPRHGYAIHIEPQLPPGGGLGSSASQSVAIIRALQAYFQLPLDEQQICALAFKTEQIFHGTPSGIDNTCATYGGILCYRRPDKVQPIPLSAPFPIVIGNTGQTARTSEMVAALRARQARRPYLYQPFFQQVELLVERALAALAHGDLEELGEIMNFNQGLLTAYGVCSRALAELIWIAREHGALGAKLTGAGGGGCMLALAPGNEKRIQQAMQQAGYHAYITLCGVAGQTPPVNKEARSSNGK